MDGGLDQRDLALGALKAVALGQAFADGRFDGARLGACVVEARSLRVGGALPFFAFGHRALRLGLKLRALAEELVRGVARARLGALALLGRARDGRLDQRQLAGQTFDAVALVERLTLEPLALDAGALVRGVGPGQLQRELVHPLADVTLVVLETLALGSRGPEDLVKALDLRRGAPLELVGALLDGVAVRRRLS